MIALADYWKGRDNAYAGELTADIKTNAEKTVKAVGAVEKAYGAPLLVTSGWRPPSVNKAVGGAKSSKHLTAQACDVSDPKGDLARWCLSNLPELERIGVWLEDPSFTGGWVHLQTVPPRSGRRVFRP